MKSPVDIAKILEKKWGSPRQRAELLLNSSNWPYRLDIGKPTPAKVNNIGHEAFIIHCRQWKAVSLGYIDNDYFSISGESHEFPQTWILKTREEWIEVVQQYIPSSNIKKEFQFLNTLCVSLGNDVSRNEYFNYFIRHLHTLLKYNHDEVIQAIHISLSLEKGMAQGKPLKLFTTFNVDTKFYKRHNVLIRDLLRLKLPNEETLKNHQHALEHFLNAYIPNNNWLLIKDLDGSLLPFSDIRVNPSSLIATALDANNILIIENEDCIYQLPTIKNTIAILGAGNNLSWMKTLWLNDKNIAYWGDLDTYGLFILNQARQYQPQLTALLTDQKTFDAYSEGNAVIERTWASENTPFLLNSELALFKHLKSLKLGRLEQEKLPIETVHVAIYDWCNGI